MDKKIIDREFLYKKKMRMGIGKTIGYYFFTELILILPCILIGGMLLTSVKEWNTQKGQSVLLTIIGILSGLNVIAMTAYAISSNRDDRKKLENKEITVRRRVKTADVISYQRENRSEHKSGWIVFDDEDKFDEKNQYMISSADLDQPVGMGFYVFQYRDGEYIWAYPESKYVVAEGEFSPHYIFENESPAAPENPAVPESAGGALATLKKKDEPKVSNEPVRQNEPVRLLTEKSPKAQANGYFDKQTLIGLTRVTFWQLVFTAFVICMISFIIYALFVRDWTSGRLAKWMTVTLIIAIVFDLICVISAISDAKGAKKRNVTVERAVKTYGYYAHVINRGGSSFGFIVTNGRNPDDKGLRLYCEENLTKLPDGTELWIFRNVSDNKVLKIIPAQDYLGLVTADFHDVTHPDFYKF